MRAELSALIRNWPLQIQATWIGRPLYSSHFFFLCKIFLWGKKAYIELWENTQNVPFKSCLSVQFCDIKVDATVLVILLKLEYFITYTYQILQEVF